MDCLNARARRPKKGTEYLGLLVPALRESRLVAPFRFSDRIANATAISKNLSIHPDHLSSGRDQVIHAIRQCLEGRPHIDIKETVHGLFTRELVDIRQSGFGYGDFLLWCRFEITTLETGLFWFDCAFPDEEDEDSEDEDEDTPDEQVLQWDADEVSPVWWCFERKNHASLNFGCFRSIIS